MQNWLDMEKNFFSAELNWLASYSNFSVFLSLSSTFTQSKTYWREMIFEILNVLFWEIQIFFSFWPNSTSEISHRMRHFSKSTFRGHQNLNYSYWNTKNEHYWIRLSLQWTVVVWRWLLNKNKNWKSNLWLCFDISQSKLI